MCVLCVNLSLTQKKEGKQKERMACESVSGKLLPSLWPLWSGKYESSSSFPFLCSSLCIFTLTFDNMFTLRIHTRTHIRDACSETNFSSLYYAFSLHPFPSRLRLSIPSKYQVKEPPSYINSYVMS